MSNLFEQQGASSLNEKPKASKKEEATVFQGYHGEKTESDELKIQKEDQKKIDQKKLKQLRAKIHGEQNEDKENSAIFEEIDTNINHEITVGFSAERNLPIMEKVKEGDLVEIYGKKYLILGFTHSSEKIKDVYRIEDIVHTKEVSEKEAMEIAERKKKLDEVLHFSSSFAEYYRLVSEKYMARLDKKAEIGKLIDDVKSNIDANFISKLGEIQKTVLSPNQKRSIAYLFNNYSETYLRKKDPHNYLTCKDRARAVELISDLITGGADIMSVEEKERLNVLNGKSIRDKNLNSNEIQELVYLKKKEERIEKLLMPINWQELNYEPFDPQLEIRKIGHFREDEMAGLSSEEKMNIKKERLANYKKNLLEQKNKIADIQIDIKKSIIQNPDVGVDELMEEVYLKASGAKMTEYQIEAFRNGIEEYIKKHQAVESNRRKYPVDEKLFATCFGRTPKGDIEIIKGPMTLYFRCHDLEDYAMIHEQKFNQNDEITDADKVRSNLSAGVSISSCNVDNLRDCINAENARGRSLEKNDDATSMYIHEEQHKIKRLFKDEAVKQDLMNAMEKAPINEKTKILDDYLRTKREVFENRAKDEILAYFKDGTNLGELQKIILNTKEQGGLYDYYGEWYSKDGVNEKTNLINEGAGEYFINYHFFKIFRNEYGKDIVIPAIQSIWYLRNQGWKDEKVLNLMINEPLAKWPKLVKRIEEGNEKRK